MNRPRRPPFSPARRKKPAVARSPDAATIPRRRSPLDLVPSDAEPRFKVLGTGAERQALMTYATPTEMLVVHGFSREVEDAFARFHGRLEDFWGASPEALGYARKIDDVLAGIVARKGTTTS